MNYCIRTQIYTYMGGLYFEYYTNTNTNADANTNTIPYYTTPRLRRQRYEEIVHSIQNIVYSVWDIAVY